MKRIKITYYAALRDLVGVDQEEVYSLAVDIGELWAELCMRHGVQIPSDHLRVAVNDEFAAWSAVPSDGSSVAFMPPFAGG